LKFKLATSYSFFSGELIFPVKLNDDNYNSFLVFLPTGKKVEYAKFYEINQLIYDFLEYRL